MFWAEEAVQKEDGKKLSAAGEKRRGGGAEKPDLRARLVGHGGEPGLHPEEAGACDGFVAKERHAQICT